MTLVTKSAALGDVGHALRGPGEQRLSLLQPELQEILVRCSAGRGTEYLYEVISTVAALPCKRLKIVIPCDIGAHTFHNAL